MKAPFERILVTIDLSERSQRVLEYALNSLATKPGTHLCIFHVILRPPPNPLYAHYAETSEDDLQKERDAVIDKMRAMTPHNVPAGINLSYATAQGEPVLQILEKTQETQADVIVVSTEGREGLRGLIMSSVAESIIRAAPCPVLVVK